MFKTQSQEAEDLARAIKKILIFISSQPKRVDDFGRPDIGVLFLRQTELHDIDFCKVEELKNISLQKDLENYEKNQKILKDPEFAPHLKILAENFPDKVKVIHR